MGIRVEEDLRVGAVERRIVAFTVRGLTTKIYDWLGAWFPGTNELDSVKNEVRELMRDVRVFCYGIIDDDIVGRSELTAQEIVDILMAAFPPENRESPFWTRWESFMRAFSTDKTKERLDYSEPKIIDYFKVRTTDLINNYQFHRDEAEKHLRDALKNREED